MSTTCCDSCSPGHESRPASSRIHPALLVLASGALIALGAAAPALGAPRAGVMAFLAAIALSIPKPARRAWQSLRLKSLDINVLMVIAVAGAVALGDWFEAATVVWLFGVAQWLEGRSMARAQRAIRSLLALSPGKATVRRSGVEQEIAASDLAAGDVVIVRPGERFPVDGIVALGASAVNQAPVTGESFPVEKAAGDTVFAGTINGTGALEIHAVAAASDSTLARIIHLVEHAQEQRAPIQTFVDRFARRYTPAIVVLAILVAFVPPFIFGGHDGWTVAFATWSYRALALLVVACPCALVISTPVSIVSALTAGARHGVLIKGGTHLERLGELKCVAFDKTGTLTDGRVTVTDVFPVEGATRGGVLSVAAALESRSEHPIGRAITARARTEGVAVAAGEGFTALPGLGAVGTVDAASAVIGSHRLFESRQLCTPGLHTRAAEVERGGGMPVLVSHGGSALGVIELADRVRDGGRQVVDRLRDQGVKRVVLLSGDHSTNVRAVAAGTGLDEAHSELMPEDKVEHVARLRDAYGTIAMVGDGVNDAPALAAADVGIAMGAAGTDVAIETADVALMADDLAKLPYAVRLGRATLANIRANVAIALGLKLAFVGLAMFGMATLWLAVLADTGASLLVTANSLRLLRVR